MSTFQITPKKRNFAVWGSHLGLFITILAEYNWQRTFVEEDVERIYCRHFCKYAVAYFLQRCVYNELVMDVFLLHDRYLLAQLRRIEEEIFGRMSRIYLRLYLVVAIAVTQYSCGDFAYLAWDHDY